MRRLIVLVVISLALAGNTFATVFGTVRGIVHDPKHRPIAGVTIVLSARDSNFTMTASTDAEGQFHFDAVSLGEYTVAVSDPTFMPETHNVTVLSGSAPILHFELHLASQNESVTVTANSAAEQTESATPTSLINREEIRDTPGATRSNSLAMITNYVPGAYVTHDQLHVRGGHQVSWLIDGVPIPNTNIASNLGPQIDPKDIETVEAQRGSYSADFGDRTYGVFNIAPRTGFEWNNDAELVTSFGNFFRPMIKLGLAGTTTALLITPVPTGIEPI
ncbi:MAG TPA: carboxypeptidase regulatory-like domain-containing protein [Candidatus Acidoferrum sp.]|nr:carboxypeptidase regulatory-like domain-containing protein [Candidatus Acidoferrum sp.]